MEDAARNPETPNVLLICTDQLRADWLGCNRHPLVLSPQIDKLAHQGVNFQRAFSECPVCVPARRILMTGQDPYSIHMNTNRDGQPFSEGPKLAEVMTAAGYQTFASGKLHTCPQRNRIGFEDVQLNEEGRKQNMACDDYEAYLNDHGYGHLAYTHGLGNNQYGMRFSPVPENLTTTHWTAQKAMEFVERRDPTRPFFLYVSFDKPHPPITPPESYYNLYREAEMPQPVQGSWLERRRPNSILRSGLRQNLDVWQDHPLRVQQTLRGYAALITHIDSMIGVILGTIREAGLLNNTAVLFVSDHGDALFDHGATAKSDFLRGSAGIPFIVRPAKTWEERHNFRPMEANRRNPAALMDVMPTVLDLCNIPVPEEVQGRSVVPLLLDQEAGFRPLTFGNCGANYAVTDGRHKFLWYSDDNVELLFDLEDDPAECNDLSEDAGHREVLDHLRSSLAHWIQSNGDPHAQNGTLNPIAVEWHMEYARSSNIWNNRGRH